MTCIGMMIVFLSSLFQLNQEYIGYSLIIACVLYFIHSNDFLVPKLTPYIKSFSKKLCLSLHISFFLLFIISILIEIYSPVYNRPTVYFIVLSIICVNIFSQIFFLRSNKMNISLIILEIFLFSLNLNSSVFYLFPGIHGVDSWYHLGLINEILNTGFINSVSNSPNGSDFSVYARFPLMHVEASILKAVTSLNIKDSCYFISVIAVLSTLYVFLIGKLFFDIKTGLLSMLILSFSDQFINWTINITPMTLGLAFYLIIVFLIFRTTQDKKNKLIFTTLFLLILGTIVLTHTIASFIALVIMFSLLISAKLYKLRTYYNQSLNISNLYINVNLVLLFFVFMISYWILAFSSLSGSDSFFNTAILSIKNALMFSDVGGDNLVTQVGKLSSYIIALNHIGYSIMIVFSFFGGLVLISDTNIGLRVHLLIISIFLYICIYVPALFGSNATLPHRWFLFLYPFISILTAFGVFSLFNVMKSQKFVKKEFLFLFFMSIFTFFMITNSISNSDSPVYPADSLNNFSYSRSYYYESEMVAGMFAAYNCEGTVVTDRRYFNAMKYWHKTPSLHYIILDKPQSYSTGIIFLRETVLNEKILDSTTNYVALYMDFPQKLKNSFDSEKYSLVYSNNKVRGYLCMIE